MTISIDQQLRKAKRLAKTGETDLAGSLYRKILEKYQKKYKSQKGA